jgi:hypothetical protein
MSSTPRGVREEGTRRPGAGEVGAREEGARGGGGDEASVTPEAIQIAAMQIPELPRRTPRPLDSRVAKPARVPIDPAVLRKVLDHLNHLEP